MVLRSSSCEIEILFTICSCFDNASNIQFPGTELSELSLIMNPLSEAILCSSCDNSVFFLNELIPSQCI